MMHFFCLITPRDWFINLCDRILRAGEQALDHLWPCGKCVSLLTRKFVTSLGKCLLFEVGGCGTKNEPRSLASPVSFFFFFSFSHGLKLTLSRVKKRPRRNADIDGPLASFWQSINQSEEGLNSNLDLIIRVFKSLIVAFTFSSHKPCNVYIL